MALSVTAYILAAAYIIMVFISLLLLLGLRSVVQKLKVMTSKNGLIIKSSIVFISALKLHKLNPIATKHYTITKRPVYVKQADQPFNNNNRKINFLIIYMYFFITWLYVHVNN